MLEMEGRQLGGIKRVKYEGQFGSRHTKRMRKVELNIHGFHAKIHRGDSGSVETVEGWQLKKGN